MSIFFLLGEGFMFLKASAEMSFKRAFLHEGKVLEFLRNEMFSRKFIACI